jgi:hypothetical protein
LIILKGRVNFAKVSLRTFAKFTPMKYAICIGVIVVICIILIVRRPNYQNFEIGHEQYFVLEEFNDKAEAAKRLAELNKRVLLFLTHMKDKYGVNKYDGSTNGLNPILTGIATRILTNYNPEVIMETDPKTSSDTSYTIDKGRKLFICMRSKTPPYKIHDIDDLFFVVLHEIGHMGSTTYGHNAEFWQTFKFLLHEAVESGLYTPKHYRQNPIKYCGLAVDYNPYFDSNVFSIWI